jgi:hypothetical protein
MSIQIARLSADIEVGGTIHKINYVQTKLDVVKFAGGSERGTSLQLSFLNEDKERQHIQLDNDNVKELIQALIEYFK